MYYRVENSARLSSWQKGRVGPGPPLRPTPQPSTAAGCVASWGSPGVCVGGVSFSESQSHPPLPENRRESVSGYVWSQGVAHPGALNPRTSQASASPLQCPGEPGTGLGPGPAQSKQGYECLLGPLLTLRWPGPTHPQLPQPVAS